MQDEVDNHLVVERISIHEKQSLPVSWQAQEGMGRGLARCLRLGHRKAPNAARAGVGIRMHGKVLNNRYRKRDIMMTTSQGSRTNLTGFV